MAVWDFLEASRNRFVKAQPCQFYSKVKTKKCMLCLTSRLIAQGYEVALGLFVSFPCLLTVTSSSPPSDNYSISSSASSLAGTTGSGPRLGLLKCTACVLGRPLWACWDVPELGSCISSMRAGGWGRTGVVAYEMGPIPSCSSRRGSRYVSSSPLGDGLEECTTPGRNSVVVGLLSVFESLRSPAFFVEVLTLWGTGPPKTRLWRPPFGFGEGIKKSMNLAFFIERCFGGDGEDGVRVEGGEWLGDLRSFKFPLSDERVLRSRSGAFWAAAVIVRMARFLELPIEKNRVDLGVSKSLLKTLPGSTWVGFVVSAAFGGIRSNSFRTSFFSSSRSVPRSAGNAAVNEAMVFSGALAAKSLKTAFSAFNFAR